MNEEWNSVLKRKSKMMFIKPKNSPCENCSKQPVIGRKYNKTKGEYEWLCEKCYKE